MPITETAPYGTAVAITKIMETYRETGLGGGPITSELVTRMSMGTEVARRAVLSLRLLELIDDDGNPTPNFIAFKQAPAAEYRQVFANLLIEAYAQIFAVLGRDLAGKTQTEIEDAFRTFKQASLRKRMVTCFIGLCQYAGIMEAPAGAGTPKPKVRKTPPAGTRSRRQDVDPPPPPPLTPTVDTKGKATVASLESGGTVTLTVSTELVDLTIRDREFVFDLIDRVKGYGEQKALPVASANGQEDTG
jgi:Family of unknown function (DUF5343)